MEYLGQESRQAAIEERNQQGGARRGRPDGVGEVGYYNTNKMWKCQNSTTHLCTTSSKTLKNNIFINFWKIPCCFFYCNHSLNSSKINLHLLNHSTLSFPLFFLPYLFFLSFKIKILYLIQPVQFVFPS